MPGMRAFRVTPKGFIYFCLFVVLFTAAVLATRGTQYGSIAWPIFLAVALLLLVTRPWVTRRDPDAASRQKAAADYFPATYGLFPPKVRDWFFGEGAHNGDQP
jgi:hypothetical protein